MEIKFKIENDLLVIMAKIKEGQYYGKSFSIPKGMPLDGLYEFLDEVKYEIRFISDYGRITGLIKTPIEERTDVENEEIWKNF
jgi:hypothetical protein